MRQIAFLFTLLALIAPALRAVEATLRPGDTFEMRLTGMPAEVIQDISLLQYTIGPEGTVNIPFIGKVKAIGLSAAQLSDAIEAKFIADKIFTKPTVIINLRQGERFVSVSGGVRAPQRVPWSADLTLSAAIGNCGGLSDFGSPKGVTLIRGGRIEGTFNLKEIAKDPARDPKLLPGDQVTVPGG